MMSFEEIVAWADAHRYPRLVLENGMSIDAGVEGWFAYLAVLTENTLARVQARIQQWEAAQAREYEVSV